MRCADARNLASDYIDGDLAPEVALELEEHLQTCASCPPLAAALLVALAELRKLPEVAWPGLLEGLLFEPRDGSKS